MSIVFVTVLIFCTADCAVANGLLSSKAEQGGVELAGVQSAADGESAMPSPHENATGTESPISPRPTGPPPVVVDGPLSFYARHTGEIDYVAAGAAMRNQGYGTITVNWTGSLVAAYLVWSLMADTAPTNGTMNGVRINGTVFDSTPNNPCWRWTIFTLVSDVTAIVVNGVNHLSEFPSGITDGQDPWSMPVTSPLLEGASLIVIFHAVGSSREITISLAANTVGSPENDVMAHAPAQSTSAVTTFIVADGQMTGNTAFWNSAMIDSNAFPGADPRNSTLHWSQGNLWDTRTYPVSVAIGSTMETPGISRFGDCLTWTGQVLRVDMEHVIVDNPPVAFANASPMESYMGEFITFNGSESSDDFGITAYAWDFGDGATNMSVVASHAYASRGTFTAALTVWDTAGQNDTDSVSVNVVNRRPVADAGQDRDSLKRVTVTLDGTRSFDPDGDVLRYAWTQTGGPIVSLSWATTARPILTPVTVGVYRFRLVVDDGYGGNAEDTVAVNVPGLPPTARILATPEIANVGELISFDGSASSDLDGVIVSFAFELGSIGIVNGSQATLSHAYTNPGTYTVTLTVTDDDGNIDEANVTVTIVAPSMPADLNLKPVVAALFASVLAVLGSWSSRRRPWRRKDQRESAVSAFILICAPFLIAEVATGVISFVSGQLSIPPVLGLGTAVDVAILAAGLAVSVARLMKAKPVHPPLA